MTDEYDQKEEEILKGLGREKDTGGSWIPINIMGDE